jgi:membrane peptidoglycan carboxypeptidase
MGVEGTDGPDDRLSRLKAGIGPFLGQVRRRLSALRRRSRPGAAPRHRAFPTRRTMFRAAALCIGIVVGAVAGLMLYVAVALPFAGGRADAPAGPSLLLADATGGVFASRGHFRGAWLTLDELPKYVPQAVIAMEDRRFYSHPGIDILGIARAAFVDLRAGAIREGGSTITQQLAKVMFLTPERSFSRKAKEAAIAIWLELRLSKDEILARYLNSAYFGAGAYGIDGAAQRYFDKSARDLSLPETAMLAGLIKAPSQFSPARDPEAARARAAVVLDAMVDDGAIDAAQADAAKRAPADLAAATAQALLGSNFFADWVAADVRDRLGPVRGDFRVDTTLDPELQEAAEHAVDKWLAREGKARSVGEAALVALGYDGAVLAMVGGRDYAESQFNRATLSRWAHGRPRITAAPTAVR